MAPVCNKDSDVFTCLSDSRDESLISSRHNQFILVLLKAVNRNQKRNGTPIISKKVIALGSIVQIRVITRNTTP